ncbi:hypothetical protein COO60DRAFT_1488802 [Scenedesmus sp. NREL 46B-D3]|nr:hypothetical protein COO60DRAFT_1488802 [Scenedesmus sp. NREL 46B-D3]
MRHSLCLAAALLPCMHGSTHRLQQCMRHAQQHSKRSNRKNVRAVLIISSTTSSHACARQKVPLPMVRTLQAASARRKCKAHLPANSSQNVN